MKRLFLLLAALPLTLTGCVTDGGSAGLTFRSDGAAGITYATPGGSHGQILRNPDGSTELMFTQLFARRSGKEPVRAQK